MSETLSLDKIKNMHLLYTLLTKHFKPRVSTNVYSHDSIIDILDLSLTTREG